MPITYLWYSETNEPMAEKTNGPGNNAIARQRKREYNVCNAAGQLNLDNCTAPLRAACF